MLLSKNVAPIQQDAARGNAMLCFVFASRVELLHDYPFSFVTWSICHHISLSLPISHLLTSTDDSLKDTSLFSRRLALTTLRSWHCKQLNQLANLTKLPGGFGLWQFWLLPSSSRFFNCHTDHCHFDACQMLSRPWNAFRRKACVCRLSSGTDACKLKPLG